MRINKINKYISTFETKKERFIFYKKSSVKDQLENTKYKLIIINDLSVII